MKYAVTKYISPLYMVGWNSFMHGINFDKLLENFVEVDGGSTKDMFRRYDLVAGYMGAIYWTNKNDRHMLP